MNTRVSYTMSNAPMVRIIFWDHYQSDAPSLQLVPCAIYGVLAKEDKLSYSVLSWIYDGQLDSHNSDGYCILKSSVLSFTKLEEANDSKDADGYKRSKSNIKNNRK